MAVNILMPFNYTCSVGLTLHNTRRTTITRLILNSVRFTQTNTTCCHSTKV